MRVIQGVLEKKIIKIVKNKRLTFFYKLELFFLGLKYAKYIFIIFLVIIDFFLLLDEGINGILTNDIFKISFGIQGISLIIYIIYNMLSLKINYKTVTKEFTSKDMIYLLLLNICTIPAIVIGSFLGFIRSKGNFYRTKRNE